jgi:hypothetical protein
MIRGATVRATPRGTSQTDLAFEPRGAGRCLQRRERRERAVVALRERSRVLSPLCRTQAERHERFDGLERRRDALDHRRPDRARHVVAEIRHAGATEHDRFGAVIVDRAAAFGNDLLPSVVTTLKLGAMKLAMCIAASAMPTTGPRATSRAAYSPGSPKHAIT